MCVARHKWKGAEQSKQRGSYKQGERGMFGDQRKKMLGNHEGALGNFKASLGYPASVSQERREGKRKGRGREERKGDKEKSRQVGWGDGSPVKYLSHRPEGPSLILKKHIKNASCGDVGLESHTGEVRTVWG